MGKAISEASAAWDGWATGASDYELDWKHL